MVAYKAQFAYDPYSVMQINSASHINSFKSITPVWVQNIVLNNKHSYGVNGSANTGLIPLNVNSNALDFMKAYPWLDCSSFTTVKTLKEYGNLKYKK